MTALVQHGYSREQLDLIKRTFAAGTSDDEFALFIQTTKRLGLDVFAKQAHCVKRWSTQHRCEIAQTQVSIDGFRVVAERTGQYEGQTPPQWCGEDGAWRDVWLAKVAPSAARVGVYRRGMREPIYGIATLASFGQRAKDGNLTRMWSTMCDVMLAKCAESQALRKAFPHDLSGIYSEEEMGQASNDEHLSRASAKESAIAEEQAKRRLEAEAIADEWGPMIDAIDSREMLESFCYLNGYQFVHLHPNAKSRLWTRISKKAEAIGVSPNDLRPVIQSSPVPAEEEEVADV